VRYKISPFIYRIIIVTIFFGYLKLIHFESLPILVILLILSDPLDCRITLRSVDCKSLYYQKHDKMTDLICYIIFLTLFHNLFDCFTLQLLIGFTLYRAIGVYLFVKTSNCKYIQYFPDFINSTMVAYTLYRMFYLKRYTYYILIILGMVGKILFEIYHHSHKYNNHI